MLSIEEIHAYIEYLRSKLNKIDIKKDYELALNLSSQLDYFILLSQQHILQHDQDKQFDYKLYIRKLRKHLKKENNKKDEDYEQLCLFL